ncbi:FAD-binding oxidoreductase [Neorhodopirellula pilleata]|uniref:Flavohemoprotein n=1 Tax=Neorhodopirellula pilleata TaxID=2714738 RepID=A0A5C6A867_9BACT|nr:FAD-binding oxidoreductase [Neorhodopirellula pilleata]TWT95580.1 Flavohemoprotein [Neorhodopirellula pilleata]
MSWFVLASLLGCVIGYPVIAEFIARREDIAWGSSDRDELTRASKPHDRSDRFKPNLAQIDPIDFRWKGWRTMEVVGLDDESPDCRSFRFRPLDGLGLPTFLGGQFITVRVQDPVTGRRTSRCYSLSSSPGEPHFRITVKRVPGGLVSNILHDRIQLGDLIDVQAPAGRFHLGTERHDRPLVLIAAGIGITPMLSMLMHSLEIAPARPIRLFYQLRDSDNAPFLGLLRRIHAKLADAKKNSFGLHVWFSQANSTCESSHDRPGRIDAAQLLDQLKTLDADFRICGPDAFMSGIAEGLVECGVEPSRVQYESFGGSSKGVGAIRINSDETDRQTKSLVTHQVTFQSSGKESTWNGTQESLLDFAEQEGVEIESSCRSGSCGSCVRGLLKGKVRYDQEPSCEIEADEVVMCIAQPESDVSIDA